MKYELQQCIGSRLRSLSRIVDSYFRRFLTDFGITENQMTILFVLSKFGKIEQGKIGETLILERSTVSRNVRLLETRSLVIRSSKYRPEVELTKQGERLVKEIIPHWEEVMDELVKRLGNTGMRSMESLEEKIK